MKTSHSTASVESTVLRLVQEVVPWQFTKTPLASQLSLQGDLGIDSMGKLSVAFRLEQEFGVNLTEHMARVADIRTVGDVVGFVRELLEAEA